MKLPVIKKEKKTDVQHPNIPSALATLEKGLVSLADVISPSSIEVDFKFIRIGERFYSTLFIVGYPRYVSPNWLEPLINFSQTMDIAMFCYPTSSADVLADLKRKITEMEVTIYAEEKAGRPGDPQVKAALEDAYSLQEELAKGIERFFQFSFYITISAASTNELYDATRQLQTTLASMLLTAKTATLQMEEGFKSTIPMGQDKLYIPRNMDTTSLASTFPFTSAMLTQNKGVMYGINQQNGSLIVFDRFSLENANEVVLGKSGSGKSFMIKLEIMRQFMLGTEVIVVDPEGEYGTIAKTLGGDVVEFSPSSPVKINPFDLSQLYEEGENELGLKILSLHGLMKIIMGDLDPAHDSILDNALVEAYRQKGITPDPETQKKKPPLMEDLYKVLMGMENTVAKDMGFRLEKFIKGSAAGIFNQDSNFDITSPLTVFSIKNLEEELRPIAMHIILDFVWTKVKKSLKRRLLILDEAWYMMKYEDSASFVYSIAKRARKYYLGMTTATQDVEDFLKTDYGKAVLTNSSIQILLKQGTAEVEMVSNTFFLSEGEKLLLTSADIGEGLFFAGQNHVAMKVIAAPFEHDLITSNPAEILRRQQEAAAHPKEEAAPPPWLKQAQDSAKPELHHPLEANQQTQPEPTHQFFQPQQSPMQQPAQQPAPEVKPWQPAEPTTQHMPTTPTVEQTIQPQQPMPQTTLWQQPLQPNNPLPQSNPTEPAPAPEAMPSQPMQNTPEQSQEQKNDQPAGNGAPVFPKF